MADAICFHCGQAMRLDPPRFNRLPSGESCPSCRDRILDALPPLLPGSHALSDGEQQESWGQGDAVFDGGPPDDPIGA